jgi:hypothetical protein
VSAGESCSPGRSTLRSGSSTPRVVVIDVIAVGVPVLIVIGLGTVGVCTTEHAILVDARSSHSDITAE